jgi:hypothetical protein
VTGIACGVFGLLAGSLNGLWAGRAISARRLRRRGALLPPNTSSMVAWSYGAVPDQTIAALSRPEARGLILNVVPVPAGRG